MQKNCVEVESCAMVGHRGKHRDKKITVAIEHWGWKEQVRDFIYDVGRGGHVGRGRYGVGHLVVKE